MASAKRGIGRVLAPWPFLLFAFMMLLATIAASAFLGFARGVMLGFDVGAFAFLIACAPLFRHKPREMRQSAERNDANRGSLLLLATVVTGIIMVSVGMELAQKGRPHPIELVLVICTLSGSSHSRSTFSVANSRSVQIANRNR